MIHDLKDNCIQPKLIDKRRDFRVEDEAISDSVVPDLSSYRTVTKAPIELAAVTASGTAVEFKSRWR